MNTSRTILSVIASAAAPAAAIVALASSASADVTLGLVASAGLIAFALLDYSRYLPTFQPKAEIVRPRFRGMSAAPVADCTIGRAA